MPIAIQALGIQALAEGEISCHHTTARYAAAQGARTSPHMSVYVARSCLTPHSHTAIVHRVNQAKRASRATISEKGHEIAHATSIRNHHP
jgi:hypothetical protein